MSTENLIACHECDLLQHLPEHHGSYVVRCSRCNALVHRGVVNSIDRTLALTLACTILFVVANSFPLLAFRLKGQVTEATLISGVLDLYHTGKWEIAALVLMTTIVIPLIQLLVLLYVFVPLKFNRIPWKMAAVFRVAQSLTPWSMMEVFLIGIIVAVVKLIGMATIVPGTALWAFALLIVTLAAAAANMDSQVVWERVEYQR
ncbi:MAG TPA: paraquat-inducible protein A [Gammaproteobacteria bacterium]|nr:paraquat-inducible protein A [Gammaproteobacteria bacterium]